MRCRREAARALAIDGSRDSRRRPHAVRSIVLVLVRSRPPRRRRVHRRIARLLRPDPFQNAGKTVPAAPDLASMTMLTVLDISGHMGGKSEDCTWRVESLAVAGEEVGR